MTSARSVFLYLCVSLAAVAALALTAGAASPAGFPSCAEICSAPNPEFPGGNSVSFSSQQVANANSDVVIHARAGMPLRVAVTSSAANVNHEFQNTQESAGTTAKPAGSSERAEKRGTGSL